MINKFGEDTNYFVVPIADITQKMLNYSTSKSEAELRVVGTDYIVETIEIIPELMVYEMISRTDARNLPEPQP